MGIKKLIINSGTIACLLFGKLSNSIVNNLDDRKVPDNKSFWKYIKPLFYDKSTNSNKITLLEKDLILEKNHDIAETFNNFSSSVESNLDVLHYQDPFVDSDQTKNRIGLPILKVTEQYKATPVLWLITLRTRTVYQNF